MSQENVEVVRRMLDAWASGEREAARAAYDENVVFIFPVIDAPVSLGVPAMEQALETWRRTWDEYSLEIDELIDGGAHIVVVNTQRGRGKGSGIEVELTAATVYTVLGSKIVRGEVFDTKEQALEAAGLSELAMSEENVEIVRGYIDAINRGDWAATLEASLHEDIEIDWSRSPAPYKGIYHGREEAMRFAEALDVWQGARLDASEFIEAGDDVLVPHVFHLRGRDGIEVTVRATYVFTIRDGLCARWAIYQERADALEAAGLSE